MNDLHSVLATGQRATMEAQAQAQAEKDAMRSDWKNRNTSNLGSYSSKGY